MTAAVDTAGIGAALASGKGHRDENFPVASALVARRHRAPVMAFYRFARAADDVADNAAATPEARLALLGRMRATLLGQGDADAPSATLREVQRARGIDRAHALDLLEAFSRDCMKQRYATWDELMDYCRWSAMPVGRWVLDAHGEDREATWAASDALCSALQVINHLQDCGKDRADLDRVYLPLDALAAEGIGVEALDAPAASPALRRVLDGLLDRTDALLDASRPFASRIRNRRLAWDVAVIQRLAEGLTARLRKRDPLSQEVHHSKAEMARLAMLAGLDRLRGRK